MAIEYGLQCVTAIATADYSTKQYHVMVYDGTNDQKALIGSAVTQPVFGILQDKPSAAGMACNVAYFGFSKAVRGAGSIAIAAGTWLVTDANGRVVAIDNVSDGATVWVVGVAHAVFGAANDGEIITIKVCPQAMVVGAAVT